jgi:DeoR family transcriptional regulator, aga operon transcriptional repressor
MSRHERLGAVLQILAERGSLSIDEAVAELGTSPATVRRDFDHLAQQQLLTRTRGGAVATTVSYDLPLRYKVGQRAAEKERIAQAVASLIRPGSVVGLNGGTTLTQVGRALALHEAFQTAVPGEGLTIVTNALNIANELVVRPHIKVVVVGGVVKPRSYELVGSFASRLLEVISLDTAVIGVNAVHPQRGAMAIDEGEAAIDAQLAAHAVRTVVAADSSKLNATAFARIVPIGDIDILVTDTAADADVVTPFVDAGIEVVLA